MMKGHMREYTEKDIYEQLRKRFIQAGYFRWNQDEV